MTRIAAFVATSSMASSLILGMPGALAADAPNAGMDASPQARAASTSPALVGYRPWREAEPGSWRRANDEVGRLGGHAGMLQAPPSSAPARDSPAPSPGVLAKEPGR